MFVRLAAASDSDALVRLTALTPMDGTIRLRIDRAPDFFALANARGPSVSLIAEENGRVVGTLTAAFELYRFAKEERTVAYLCDLKVDPAYRGGSVVYRLLTFMHEQVLARGVDLVLLTTAHGNYPVTSMTRGRAGFPACKVLADFRVAMIVPRGGAHASDLHEPQNDQELHSFFDRIGDRYAFRPLDEGMPGGIDFVRREEGRSVAAVSLLDTSHLKQNVVVGMPLSVRMALAGWRLARSVFLLPPAMRMNAPVRTLYVRRVGCDPGHERALGKLIAEARGYAFAQGHHFLAVAYDENDRALHDLVHPITFSAFRSRCWITSLSGDELPFMDPKGFCAMDYSLV